MKIFYLFLIASLFTPNAYAKYFASLEQLSQAKQQIGQIIHGKEAYDELVRLADKQILQSIPSIRDKDVTAKSRNKQDYISIGRYWWPDSTKKEGLPYIRKDGQPNPEMDKLDRLKLESLTDGVNCLAYAYYFTDDEKYAHKALEYLRLWFIDKNTRMNPNLNYAQVIRGHNHDMGRSEGIIDTYGFVNMIQSIKILSQSSAMSKEDYKALTEWFSDFLDWLLTSKLGQQCRQAKNNHSIAYDVQVVAYALFVNKKDIAKDFIARFPNERVAKQIKPDGSQPFELARTLALHYSIFNLNHILDLCTLAKTLNIDLYHATSSCGTSIDKAIEYVAYYLGKSEKEFPFQQLKDWFFCQEKLCWLIKRSTFFQKKPRYDWLFNTYCKTKSTDIKWLLYAK